MHQSDKTIMVDSNQMDLHELARAYSDGQLNFDQYRCARRQLLDRVTGEVTIAVRQPASPMETGSPIALPGEGVSLRRLTGRVLILLVIAILVVISIVFWLNKG